MLGPQDHGEGWEWGCDTYKAGILAAFRVASTDHVSPDVHAEV
jgi:hypothetical protein